jgi:F0F1-type ATP synthase delta subunit
MSLINSYAKAILEATAETSKKETIAIIDRWLNELSAKQLLNKSSEIIFEIAKLDDKNEGVVRAKITMARKLSKDIISDIAKVITKRTNAKQIIFTEIVDPSIGGGFIINFNDTILDASLIGRANDLATSIGY